MIPEISSPTFEASPLGELSRLLHRAALLRASGEAAAADQLEEREVASALAAARAQGEEEKADALVAAEHAREEEARLLADLLAPLLARSLRTLLLPLSGRALPAPSADETRAAAPAVRRPGGPTPDIADFIDGMIAQDRPR